VSDQIDVSGGLNAPPSFWGNWPRHPTKSEVRRPYDRGWHATNKKSYRKCWTCVAHRTMPKEPAAVIDTLRTARKGVHTGPTASTPARALEKKKLRARSRRYPGLHFL